MYAIRFSASLKAPAANFMAKNAPLLSVSSLGLASSLCVATQFVDEGKPAAVSDAIKGAK